MSARSVVSTSVTSWFGKIRHWTSTESEEEDVPYMPADNADQSEPTQQSFLSEEAGSNTKRAGLGSIGEEPKGNREGKGDELNEREVGLGDKKAGLTKEKEVPMWKEVDLGDMSQTEKSGAQGDYSNPAELIHKPNKTELHV